MSSEPSTGSLDGHSTDAPSTNRDSPSLTVSKSTSPGSLDGHSTDAPITNRDSPSLTASESTSTDHQNRPRRSELPSGDSVMLRLARRIGLR